MCIRDRRTDDFQIDFAALEAAFSEKTAALIVNSPNNPTGAILSAETLAALGDFLRGKEALYGKEIYLISDEPYREIVYDGCRAAFPADYYDDTIICYSYSKSLSLPGERIGYILVSPRAGSRADLFLSLIHICMFVFQTILNVFGCTDLLPFTGVTFPFVSNGGTSMIVSWALLAFLKSADTRQKASLAVKGGART